MRLVILDKDRALADTMAAILGTEPDVTVMAAAISIAEVEPYLGECDVVLVTADLPGGTILDLAHAVEAEPSPPQIVLMDLAHSDEQEIYLRYARAGVAAFALEDESVEDVLEKMRDVHRTKRAATGLPDAGVMSLAGDHA